MGGAVEALWRRVLKFVGPAALIPLADPIQGLVDTVCVGQLAGTQQLAALGPNTLIFNFVVYLFFGIGSCTTIFMGKALNPGNGGEPSAEGSGISEPDAAQVLACACLVAVALGLANIFVLRLLSGPALTLVGTSAALVAAGESYLQVRSLAAPAVLLSMAAQGALLSVKDSKTPLCAVLLAVGVNIALDVLLVGRMGLEGAALATVVAQHVQLALLFGGLLWPGRPWKRGRAPSAGQFFSFLRKFCAISVMYVVKNFCYLALIYRVFSLRVLELAAHQVAWSVWCICSYLTAPGEQVAFAFIPAARSPEEESHTIRTVLALGLAAGVLTGAGCALALSFPALFTSDATLWPDVRGLVAPAFLSLLLCGVEVASGGVLLAKEDFGYVQKALILALVVMGGYMWTSQKMVWGLRAIWWGLALFMGCRMSLSASRVLVRHLPELESRAARHD